MATVHIKRYRMEMQLPVTLAPIPPLPTGYRLVPWAIDLIQGHAAAKFASFQSELDAIVFPSLATDQGCRKLMRDIADQQSFVPEATWLILFQPPSTQSPQAIATVQGIREQNAVGSIQNVGVAPQHRGRGLGTALVLSAVRGFQATRHAAVTLEVTARNSGALNLYRRLGFEIRKTVYRTVDIP